MRFLSTFFFGLCMCGFVGMGFGQPTFPKSGIPPKDAVYYLIRGAVVHTAPGQSERSDILVYRGEIIDVGADILHPENTVVVAYPGMHVFHSFVEMNSGYGVGGGGNRAGAASGRSAGPKPERQQNRAMYWNEAFHPEVDAVDDFSPDTAQSARLRAKGVGVVLVHRRDGIGRGSSALVLAGNGNANESVLLSRAAMHYAFDKGSSEQDYPKSLMGAMALLRQAFYDVEWYGRSPRGEVNFSLEAAMKKDHLPKIFHAGNTGDLERIHALSQEFGMDFIAVGAGDAYRLLSSTEHTPKAIVAPLDFPDPYDVGDPESTRFVSQTDLLHWERAPFNPYFVVNAGVPLALSTEGLKDRKGVFRALRKAVASGLDPDSALAALTTVPARLLGVDDRLGKIAPGYGAHFFVATGDPRTDSDAEIVSHWVDGREHVLSDGVVAALKGRYGLNLNQYYPTLVLGGKSSLKAHVEDIRDGDTTQVAAEVKVQGNEVKVTFANPRGAGYYRLGATMLSGRRIWDGFGTDPEGEQLAWTAIREADRKTGGKQDSVRTDSIAPPPAMRTPLTAYGRDSLPPVRTLWIKNATLWTNDSAGVVPNGSLLIADGKIVAVGKDVDPERDLPRGQNEEYEVWDAKGKNITPGLVDDHSHIAIRGCVNEGSHANSAAVRIGDVINPDDINIFRQLAGGVTTSQLLHGSANPIGGQSAIVKLRWGESADGMVFEEAPPFIKFALGENVKQTNWGDLHRERYPQTRMGVEQFFYESFVRAKAYGLDKKRHEARKKPKKKRQRSTAAEPSDFRRDLALDALLEILEGERHITCHAYVQSEMQMLLHVADSLGFKVNTYTHGLEAYKMGDDIKRRETAVSTFSDWWAFKYEVLDAIPHNASILNRLGVLTAINSDDPEMGRRLNQEAAKSVMYGNMSEVDALKMVTLNPAKMMHIDAHVGSLTPGKHADFVIWSDHPLSAYAVADKTFIDGKLYFDREALDGMMKRDRADRSRIANRMLEAKENGADAKKPERLEEPNYHCDSP